MVVVTDHDSKVLARRTFRVKAWDLGAALDWAAERAAKAGFAGVTVACEPTGHRWRVLGQLADERGMSFVCVQPAVSAWARKTEDLTTDKTDDKDAVLIARLTAQLRCYLPEPVDETWGRLRHLGTRREQLLEEHVRVRAADPRPARVRVARRPGGGEAAVQSTTWVAAMTVVMDRDGGDLERTRRLGAARFERAVRKEVTRRGGQRPCLRIVRQLFAALTDPAGVLAHRPAAFERIAWVIDDWDHAKTKLADTEARMVAVLDELELTELVTSIDGLSPVGAAAILAETGDLTRFTSARAVVKHAGLAPRETEVRHLHRPRPPHRSRPSAAARRRLAGRVGLPANQPGVRRPLPAPDHPRDQQAQAHPGTDRRRRGDPAPAALRDHPPPGVGPRRRRPRHPNGGGGCGITRFVASAPSGWTRPKGWGGASLPRH